MSQRAVHEMPGAVMPMAPWERSRQKFSSSLSTVAMLSAMDTFNGSHVLGGSWLHVLGGSHTGILADPRLGESPTDLRLAPGGVKNMERAGILLGDICHSW